MKYHLSKHAQEVMEKRGVQLVWIETTLLHPTLVASMSDNEVHYYSLIRENENRCLKVVCNPLKELIVTVYFDRNMRKKGCQ